MSFSALPGLLTRQYRLQDREGVDNEKFLGNVLAIIKNIGENIYTHVNFNLNNSNTKKNILRQNKVLLV